MRRVIIDEQPINPKYYEKMSDLLDALIKERKEQALEYEQYLKKIIALARQVQNPQGGADYPQSLNTPAKRALFDNLDRNETLALALDADIRRTKKDSWRGNKIKEKEIRFAIRRHLSDLIQVDRVFDLIWNQNEY